MVSGVQLLDVILNGLTIGMVYVLVATGLSIVFGVMGVLNLAHGELLALGSYFAFSLVTGFDAGGFWVALIAVPLLVGAIGAVTDAGSSVACTVADSWHRSCSPLGCCSSFTT